MFNGGIGRSAAHPRMTGLGVGSPWRHAPNSGTVSVVIPFRQWPQVNSADEMSHMWIGATYLSDEDFEYLKAQRQQRLALLEQEQGGG